MLPLAALAGQPRASSAERMTKADERPAAMVASIFLTDAPLSCRSLYVFDRQRGCGESLAVDYTLYTRMLTNGKMHNYRFIVTGKPHQKNDSK